MGSDSRGLALLFGVALIGCTRRAPDPPRAEPVPPSPATASTSVVPTPPTGASPAEAPADAGPLAAWAAWTDPRAVDGLARSCSFEPPPPKGADDFDFSVRPGPLSCRLTVEQACIADPCHHEDWEQCRASCATTCTTCGSGCSRACESCKAPCKDDACRRKCAETCGQCKQSCLTTRDNCATAGCTQVHTTCREKLFASWFANNCDAVCGAVKACIERCERTSASAKPKPPGAESDGNCYASCNEKVAGTRACHANAMLCDEMQFASERTRFDPKWKKNDCDAVCKRIWSCAQAACAKSGCEPEKQYAACEARTTGAAACGLKSGLWLLCPQPE